MECYNSYIKHYFMKIFNLILRTHIFNLFSQLLYRRGREKNVKWVYYNIINYNYIIFLIQNL